MVNRTQYAFLSYLALKDLDENIQDHVYFWSGSTRKQIDRHITDMFDVDISNLSGDTKRRALEDLIDLGFLERDKRTYKFPEDSDLDII